MATAQQRSAGSPSTSGRQQVTPRPQANGRQTQPQLYPKRVGGGYEFVEDSEADPWCSPGAVNQALRALPASTHPYSQYDLDLLAEILRHGDAHAHKEACSGNGSGEVSASPFSVPSSACIFFQYVLRAFAVTVMSHVTVSDWSMHVRYVLQALTTAYAPATAVGAGCCHWCTSRQTTSHALAFAPALLASCCSYDVPSKHVRS